MDWTTEYEIRVNQSRVRNEVPLAAMGYSDWDGLVPARGGKK